MSRSLVERRLTEVAEQLKAVRQELAVVDEQLAQLDEEATDARLRAMVSETPVAEREHREADRHAEAMRRHRTQVAGELSRLERSQDELLDRLLEH
jgi:chromosome segregation ATPase